MFFFYASSWLAERAADWLIVQGGYYMAAIAMRSSPIIPFRRDHQESPPPAHPSSLFHPCPSISPLPFSPCPFFLPPSSHTHTHTRMQRRVNRAPPALSEQMGAAEDSRLVSLLFPALCTHTFLQHNPVLSSSLSIRTGVKPRQTTSTSHAFVFRRIIVDGQTF